MLSVAAGQHHRLPTLREADAQQELVNMAAAVLSAAVSQQSSREFQQQQLQAQLQQQQQQYAILLAQAVQQQQQQQQQAAVGLLPSLAGSASPLSPARMSHHSLFQFQPATTPTSYPVSPTSSYSQLVSAPAPSSASARPTSTFILPLAESTDQSGSHDSGLGSGHQLGSGPASQPPPQHVIRRLQLIGEAPDGSGGACASVNSLQSSDSDRMRMDSSLESMASGGGRPSLPTLRQQLEYIRLGSSTDASEGCRTPSSTGGTLRRNGGPFITRSTSEKVHHRNETLAQVQRTTWARHTTK